MEKSFDELFGDESDHEASKLESEHDATILDASTMINQSIEQYSNFNSRLSNQANLISNLQLRLADYKRRMTQMSKVSRRSQQHSSSAVLGQGGVSPRTPFGELPNVTFSPRNASTPTSKANLWDPVENFHNLSKQLDERERLLIELNDTLRDDLEEASFANDDLSRQNSRLIRANNLLRKSCQEIEADSEKKRRTEMASMDAAKVRQEKLLTVWKSLNDLRPYVSETKNLFAEKFAQLSTEIHGITVASQGALQKFSLRLNYERAMNQIMSGSGSGSEFTFNSGSGGIEQMMSQNLQHIRHVKSKFEKEKLDLKTSVNELESQNRQLKSDLENQRGIIDRQTKEIDHTFENLYFEQIFTDLADHIESNSPNKSAVGRRSRSLSPAVYKMGRNVVDQIVSNPEIEARIRAIYESLHRKREDFEEMKYQYETSQSKILTLSGKLQDSATSQDQLEKEIERLRDQLSGSSKENDADKLKFERLNMQLSQLQVEKVALQSQRDSVKSNLDLLTAELHKNRNELFDVKRINCKLEDERVHFLEDFEKLRADKERSQATASNLQMQCVASKTDVDLKERALKKTQADLQNALLDLENCQKNLTKSQGLNGNLKEQLGQSTDEISNLKEKYNGAKQKLVEYERQIAKLEEHSIALEASKREQNLLVEKDSSECNRLVQEREAMQVAMRAMESDKTVLTAQLEKLTYVINDLEFKLAENRQKLSDADTQKQSVLQKLQQANDEVDQLKSDLSKKSADFSEFQGENRKILKEFETKLMELEDESEKQKFTLSELYTEKKKLLSTIDTVSRKNQEFAEQVIKLNQSCETLHSEKCQLEDASKTSQQSNFALTEKWRQEKQNLFQRIESQEKSIVSMNQQILKLEDENSAVLSQSTENRQNFDMERSELERQHANLVDSLKKSHARDIEEANSSLSEFRLALQQAKLTGDSEFKNSERKFRQEIESLETTKKELENQLHSSNVRLKDSETTLKTLHSELEAKEMENSAQNERQHAKIEELELNLERVEQKTSEEQRRLTERNEALHLDLNESKAQLEELREKNKILKGQLNETEADLSRSKRSLDKLNSEWDEEKAKFHELETEVEHLRSAMEELGSKFHASQQKMLDVVEQLADKEGLAQSLTLQNNKVLAELDEKSSDLNALKLQLHHLASELDFYKQKTKQLEVEAKSSLVLINELKAAKEKLSKKEGTLQMDLDATKEKLLDCEVKLNDYSVDNKSLHNSLVELKDEFQKKNQDDMTTIDDLRVSLQNLEQHRVQLNESLQDTRQRLVEARENLTEANQKLTNWNVRSNAISDQLKEKNDQLTKITSLLRKHFCERRGVVCQESFRFADVPFLLADEKIANATFGVDQLEGYLQNLLHSQSLVTTETEVLQKKVVSLEKQLEHTQKEKSSSDSTCTEMKFKLEEFEEEKKTLEFRIESMQNLLAAQEEAIRVRNSEKNQLTSQLSQLELKERSKEAAIKKLETDLSELEETRQTLMNKLQRSEIQSAQLDSEKQNFEKNLLEKTNELEKLRVKLKRDDAEKTNMEHNLTICVEKLRKLDIEFTRLSAENNKLRSDKARLIEVESSLRQQMDLAQSQLHEKDLLETETREKLAVCHQTYKQLEQEKRLAEERLEDVKEHLAISKRDSREKSHAIDQAEQTRLTLDVRCKEAEAQLKTLQKMLALSQQTESDLKHRLQQSTDQKTSLQEQTQTLQRCVENVKGQKSECDALHRKLERDCSALRRQYKELEKDKRKSDEYVKQLNDERSALDKTISVIEKENMSLQNNVQQLQLQLARLEQEHTHKVLELSQNQKTDADIEMNRLKSEKQNLARTLEYREKLHNSRHKALDDKISAVKEQLQHEKKRWQHHRRSDMSHVTKSGQSELCEIEKSSSHSIYTTDLPSHKSHRRLKFDPLTENR